MKLLRRLPRFQQAYRELDTLAQRERWSRNAIEEFQLERLNRLWQHAIRHVPYYRNQRQHSNLPLKFSSLAEFRSLVPVLPKQQVRCHPQDFLSRQAGRGDWQYTGGSTGTPLGVYWSKAAHLEMLRAKYRLGVIWGLDIFDRHTFLWGHGASFAPGLRGYLEKLRLPLENRLRNRLWLSAYRMGPQDLRCYLHQICRFRPVSIYGYSTALFLLAREAAETAFRCDTLKAAILAGEPALPDIVATIQQGLKVPAVVEYGAVECGFIAGQHPDGTLRVREDTTLVETLPRADGCFDIVVTVLNNPSFPLLRYRIDDLTQVPLERPSKGFAILNAVVGRSNDIVISRSGRCVHSMGVKHVFENLSGVRRFCAHQKIDGKLHVQLELTHPRATVDTVKAEQRLSKLLEGYPATVEIVECISCSPAGKHRWIISDLAQVQS